MGTEHPETALTIHNLAHLYQAQGQYEQAQELYQRALQIQEQVLGTEQPDTALTQWELATLHQMQGQYTCAEPLYRQSLVIMEKVKPHHPSTRHLRENYHDLLRKMKRKESWLWRMVRFFSYRTFEPEKQVKEEEGNNRPQKFDII